MCSSAAFIRELFLSFALNLFDELAPYLHFVQDFLDLLSFNAVISLFEVGRRNPLFDLGR